MKLRALVLPILLIAACDSPRSSAAEESPANPNADRAYDTAVTFPLPAETTMPVPMTSKHGEIAVWIDEATPGTQVEVGLHALGDNESCMTVVENFKPVRPATVSQKGIGAVAEHNAGKPQADYCITLTNASATETSVTAKIHISAEPG